MGVGGTGEAVCGLWAGAAQRLTDSLFHGGGEQVAIASSVVPSPSRAVANGSLPS